MKLLDLREAPHLLDTCADRVWRAFWTGKAEVSRLRAGFCGHLGAAPMPFTLVALVDGRFAGTVSVIAQDADEWPALTPWIAALWVEPDRRRLGIGAALVEDAARRAFAHGVGRLHLAATDANRPFYERRGWTPRDRVVDLSVLTRDAEGPVASV